MAKGLLGWENRLVAATLATASAQATLPLSNVVDDHRAIVWRTLSHSGVSFDADFLVATAIDAIGLFGTNLTASATWRLRLSAVSAGAGELLDTGTVAAGVVAGYGQAVHVLAAAVNARYLRVNLDDSGLSAVGYIDVGAAFAGPAWRFQRNFRYGRAHGFIDPSIKTRSRGGQVWIDARPKFRVAQFELPGVTEAEVFAQALELQRQRGLAGNVLFVPNYESAYVAREAVWGHVVEATAPRHASFPAWSQVFQIEERL